jgi:hypothetical protein
MSPRLDLTTLRAVASLGGKARPTPLEPRRKMPRTDGKGDGADVTKRKLTLRMLADVEPEVTEWAWDGVVSLGTITGISGTAAKVSLMRSRHLPSPIVAGSPVFTLSIRISSRAMASVSDSSRARSATASVVAEVMCAIQPHGPLRAKAL